MCLHHSSTKKAINNNETAVVSSSVALSNEPINVSTTTNLVGGERERCSLTVSTTSNLAVSTTTTVTSSCCSSSYHRSDDEVFEELPDVKHTTTSLTRPVKGRTRDISNSVDGDAPFSRMLNQSYYLATSQEENLYLGCLVNGKTAADVDNKQQPPAKMNTSSSLPPQNQMQTSSITKQPSTSRFKVS